MAMMQKRSLLWFVPVAAGLMLALVFNQTTPLSFGLGGILFVFILVYVFLASAIYVLADLSTRLFGVRGTRVSSRRLFAVANVLAFGIILLLALNSLGQLSLQDILLVILLLGLLLFYVSKKA